MTTTPSRPRPDLPRRVLVPANQRRLSCSSVTQPPRQFRVNMPDGLVIERLPVGLAHGQWRVSFVASGVNFFEGGRPHAVGFHHEFHDRVVLEGIGSPLDVRGGGGAGGDDEQEVLVHYLDNGVTGMKITYRYNGEVVTTEVIHLVE